MSSIFDAIKETEKQLEKVDYDIKALYRRAGDNLQIPCYVTLGQMSKFKLDVVRSLGELFKMTEDHNLE